MFDLMIKNLKYTKNCLPSRWEDILKIDDINEIFSHDGINNYTNSSAEINELYDYNFIDSNINEIKNNQNINNTHRVIISTPFIVRPIISYGLMVFANDTKRCVIVRDGHTVEIIILMKGYYRPTFIKYILSKITPDEAMIIKNCLLSGVDKFVDIYLNELKLEKAGLLYAIVRMAESRDVILKLIDELDLSSNTLPWGWPKGRIQSHSFKESEFECAIREFKEEVEINLPPSIMNSDTYIEENITTLTGKKIESRYWIYVIPNEIELSKPTNNLEVCDRRWVDIETCYKLIPKAINHNTLFSKVINSTK